MLKKYLQFIKENITDIEKSHHSLGEWVEKLCEDNKEILELVKPYLENTNPTVRISNTVNVLNDYGKKSVYKVIKDYLNDTGRKGEIITFVNMTNENNSNDELNAGKNVFKSFLKVITALGLKDTKPNWEHLPDDFLLFFEYKCDATTAAATIERFNSLNMFINKLPKQNCSLYFGIKSDMNFNFGFKEGDNVIKIGIFKINKPAINFLNSLDSSSAAHLKRELAYLSTENLLLFSKVAKHMKEYHPGDTEEKSFKIEDGVLEFGYKGLGKWDNGKMDDDEKERLKTGFTEHLRKFKDCSKLQAKLKPDEKSWVRLNVKLK